MSDVLVAPVPAEVFASVLSCPHLLREVAFGTRQRDLDAAEGMTVFLYVAPDSSAFQALLRPGFVSWTGTLGRIVPAVVDGVRRGMHPDPALRPPVAEVYDYRDAAAFWHVRDLKPLVDPLPFDRFRDRDGAKLFGGFAPQWIARAEMRGATIPHAPIKTLRAA